MIDDLVPEGDAVLCESIHEQPDDGGFIYENTDKLPEYRVLKAGSDSMLPHVVPGDIIICDSTGNRFIHDGKTYHIFQYKNIIGKLRHG